MSPAADVPSAGRVPIAPVRRNAAVAGIDGHCSWPPALGHKAVVLISVQLIDGQRSSKCMAADTPTRSTRADTDSGRPDAVVSLGLIPQVRPLSNEPALNISGWLATLSGGHETDVSNHERRRVRSSHPVEFCS